MSPLQSLTKLKYLYLSGNNISDFSPIKHHPYLGFYEY
ncbi:MAG: leucine-rich repeat domain-containing protein [Clostridiaceae bacterium]|nr:leucine-rich repeat domain-containing protein [Clostridiaceae bacterium]